MFKKLLLSGAALAAAIGFAYADGAFPNYPTLNVPANTECLAYGNNNVCNQYRPAGPTALTGNETIPADTNAAASEPQTIRVPVMGVGGGKLVVTTPVTTDTIAVDALTRQLIVTPAGTIAALTVNLPAASTTMVNGQRFGLCGTQIVTALTMGAGTGNTFGSTVGSQAMLVPVVTGAASCMEWIYSKTSATAGVWYRVQ